MAYERNSGASVSGKKDFAPSENAEVDAVGKLEPLNPSRSPDSLSAESTALNKINLAEPHEAIAACERTIEKLRKELLEREEENFQLLRQIGELVPLSQEVAALKRRTSWRIMIPLRALAARLKRALSVVGRRLSPRRLFSRATRVSHLKRSQAQSLEDKLWGGFSQYALEDLEALKRVHKSGSKEVAHAAEALACWYASVGDFVQGCANASLAREAATVWSDQVRCALIEVYCRLQIGERDVARRLLVWALTIYPDDPRLHLAVANTYAGFGETSDDIRLYWINRAYEKRGLLPLAKLDPSQALTLDNLTTIRAPGCAVPDGAKVSIIMPVYNAEKTLSFTLRGLVEQTWQNIEIIVVDDCSTDGTLDIADDFARRDARIKVLRQERNLGAYSARNRGLEVATGELITVHDANDWSHPQKIEIQARHILDNKGVIGNYSHWCRALQDMMFVGKFRRKDKIIDWNPSSFLFRREVLEKVGGWDPVRISADAEFIRRVKRCFPSGEVTSACDSAPLAFALDSDDSLTKYSATHGKTVYHGLRREYQEAASYWLSSATDADLNLAHRAQTRRFPVPGRILPQRQDQAVCDILFIDDFNMSGKDLDLSMSYVSSAAAQQRTIAVFHWPHYETDVAQTLNPQVRKMAHEGRVRIVAPGEKVLASRVIVGRPGILRHMIDLCPEVEFKDLFVIAGQAEGQGDTSEQKQDGSELLRANLAALFGDKGTWIPASDAERLISQ